MKWLLKFLLILTVIQSCNQPPTDSTLTNSIKGQFSIVLMNPTVKNVKTFQFLTENRILPLPKNYSVIGVYHTKGSNDYSQTQELIAKEKLNWISLVEIKPELSPTLLYQINECTPIFHELFKKSEGIIFFGGPDIPPTCYGESQNLLTEITDAHRHYLEISMLFHLLGGYQDLTFKEFLLEKPNYKILGICLGMQSMNVATGGTLTQDIPTEIFGLNKIEEVLALEPNQQHRNYYTNVGTDSTLIWGHLHQIKFERSSFLDSINSFSAHNPFVWSSHHQCIDKVGKGIIHIAFSTDGKVVEAVKHEKYPNVIGFQFHPEVPAIYKQDELLSQTPAQQEKQSYINMYSGEKGENFHRAFWKHFGELFKK